MTNRDGQQACQTQLQAWALQELGPNAAASPESLAARFLRSLPNDDFVPALREQDALEILQAGVPADPRDLRHLNRYLEEIEERLRDEVEVFAARFFSLPVAVRCEQFHLLRGRCDGFEALSARLDALLPGLDLENQRTHFDDAKIEALGTELIELFRLRPPQRAARRAALVVQKKQESLRDWARVARRLRKRNPKWAALEEELLSRLIDESGWRGRLRSIKRSRSEQKRAAQKAATTSTARSWKDRFGLFIAVLFISFVLAIIVSIVEDPSKKRYKPGSASQNPPGGVREISLLDPQQLNDAARKGRLGEALKRLLGVESIPDNELHFFTENGQLKVRRVHPPSTTEPRESRQPAPKAPQ